MDSISSSTKQLRWANAAKRSRRAIFEAAVITAAAWLVLQRTSWPAEVKTQAIRGVLWALGSTAISTAMLAPGLAAGGELFWRMFGAGVALRFAALVWLMVGAWTAPGQEASAVLGGYVLSLSALMLIEFRHLVKQREL